MVHKLPHARGTNPVGQLHEVVQRELLTGAGSHKGQPLAQDRVQQGHKGLHGPTEPLGQHTLELRGTGLEVRGAHTGIGELDHALRYGGEGAGVGHVVGNGGWRRGRVPPGGTSGGGGEERGGRTHAHTHTHTLGWKRTPPICALCALSHLGIAGLGTGLEADARVQGVVQVYKVRKGLACLAGQPHHLAVVAGGQDLDRKQLCVQAGGLVDT
jgi:hypothetical protein